MAIMDTMEMMDFILYLVMLLFPAAFAWLIHIFIRHGDVSTRRRWILLLVYLVVVNLLTFLISGLRGVWALDYREMTLSYKFKYLGVGVILGLFVPFLVCLLTEDQVTVGGFRRYTKRFCRDLRRYFPYAIQSAKADLQTEVAGSYLSWAWWLIEPFCMMLIFALIFGVVFGTAEMYFPVFIFLGLTMWEFFSRGVSGSVDMVRMNREIVTKIYLPKYILLLAKMLVNGFKMLVSFGVIAVMMIVYRVPLSPRMLLIFPVVLVLFLLTFGVGSIMMHYGVYVNDLGYITGILLQIMMYMTGTFYDVATRVPAPYGEALERYNPVAFLLSAARDCLLYDTTPDLSLLALWGMVALVLTALGAFTIYSNENAYVKMI